MKKLVPLLMLLGTFMGAAWSHAQEANSGFELRTTITAQGTYSHQSDETENGAVRVLFYPTLKFDSHWSLDGVVQVHSQPFFFEELSTDYYGIRTDLLQAHLTYSRFWGKKSLRVKAGQLSTAFGSFLLRYDDAQNPLVDIPPTYGYYYDGATTKGLTGAEVDSTLGQLDLRSDFLPQKRE
jgi:hypothetical protein